jgi:7-carboxy-7-deazaguanine synthase
MKIVEKFISVDGEGPTAGGLSVFIRLAGCNLRCVWCDTCYAQDYNSHTEELSVEEIVDYVRSTEIEHVTLTGGEPLIHTDVKNLLTELAKIVEVHVETNGSVDISEYRVSEKVHFVVDYKLPESGMENTMCLKNLANVTKNDAYKFVISSESDAYKALQIIKENNLTNTTQVYLSCVFENFTPESLVEIMKKEKLNGAKLQLQMHKFIWDKNKRGV